MTSAMISASPRDMLMALWHAALGAVDARAAVARCLAPKPRGRVIVVGAGKAAAAMAAEVAARYGPDVEGVVVTRRGHGLKPGETSGRITILEAGHPNPDDAGFHAGHAILQCVRGLGADDRVLCLLSGGGSALLEVPLPGIAFEEIRNLNKQLLASGARIAEINAVRKHLSAVKGGRLAVAAWPAQVTTLAISDVPGDDPATIASGPTVGDPTSAADAQAILAHYRIAAAPSITAVLQRPDNETPKPGDPKLARSEFQLIATQADALAAASALARARGYHVVCRGTDVEGEAKMVAADEARMAVALAREASPALLLAGGELTVTLDGKGCGGRNREYALALALALKAHPRIWALAADTDGIDGSDDSAGAIISPDTLSRARQRGLDAAAHLQAHDSGGFFAALGDALVTGPTRTNVSDFRAVLVTKGSDEAP